MQSRKFRLGVISLVLVGMMILAGSALFSSRAEAKGQCHQINAIQTVVANFSNFTTTGEVKSGFLKGTTKFTGDPASLAQITAPSAPPIEPATFSYTGDLAITTDKGVLNTRGVGVFEGGPFGRGVQFDRVTGGTGLFNGAVGTLYFTFQSDHTGGAFTSSVTGEVCVQ